MSWSIGAGTACRVRTGTLIAALPFLLVVGFSPQPSAQDDTAPKLERSMLGLARDRDDPYRWLAILQDLALSPALGVPAYSSLLDDSREPVKRHALNALISYGTEARPAAPRIAALLDDATASQEIHVLAVDALEAIGGDQQHISGALIDYLAAKRGGAAAMQRVIDHLVWLGYKEQALRPLLLELRGHSETRVQFAAYRALGYLYPTEGDKVWLRSDTGVTRYKGLLGSGYDAYLEIQNVGAESSHWTPALVQLVQSDASPAYVRLAAIETLARLRPIDPNAVQALLGAVGSHDEFTADSAADMILSMDLRRSDLVRVVGGGLHHLNPRVQLLAARAVQQMGPDGAPAAHAVTAALKRADGHTDSNLIASFLDALRDMGPAGVGAAPGLADLLSYRAAIYVDRDMLDVLRMRAYLMAVLSDIGVPEPAYPYLVEAVAHVDERLGAYEAAAAARAAGSLGPRARLFVPYLLHAVGKRTAEEEISLERFDPYFPKEEATTFQIEAIRALGKIRPHDDAEAIEILTMVSTEAAPFDRLDSRLAQEAREALQMFNGDNRHSTVGDQLR